MPETLRRWNLFDLREPLHEHDFDTLKLKVVTAQVLKVSREHVQPAGRLNPGMCRVTWQHQRLVIRRFQKVPTINRGEGTPLEKPPMVDAGFMWPPSLRGHSGAAPHNTHTFVRLTKIVHKLKVLPNRSCPTLKPTVAAGLAVVGADECGLGAQSLPNAMPLRLHTNRAALWRHAHSSTCGCSKQLQSSVRLLANANSA